MKVSERIAQVVTYMNDLYAKRQSPNEIENARGTFDSIDARLDDSDTKLAAKANQNDLNTTNSTVATKADKTYVDTQISSIGDGSPKGTYASLSALQTAFPTGTTGIYIVTADGNWYYWNGSVWTAGGVYQSTGIADGSVTPTKTSFLQQNKNLFNLETVTPDSAVSQGTGAISAYTGYSATDFIPVDGGQSYTRSATNAGEDVKNYAWYDVNQTFISGGGGVVGQWTLTAPSNAAYIRLTLSNTNLNSYQFEQGTTQTAYVKYGFSIKNGLYEPTGQRNIANGLATLGSDGKIDRSFLGGIIISKNLFDKTKATANSSVDASTGNLTTLSGYYASDYIPVTSGLPYRASGSQAKYYAWYDASKTYISGGSDLTSLTAPSNAAYIRTTIIEADYASYQFEQGTVQTEYTPFGVTLQDGGYVLSSDVAFLSTNSRWGGKKANFLGDSITYGYSPIDGTQLPNPFPKLVGETLGLSVANNYGASGTTISGAYANRFIDRYTTMTDDADLVFVLGGTNDWAHSIPIGTISDATGDTFYGGLNILVDGLLTKYPTQTIVIATPMHRQGDTGGIYPLSDYRDAILNIGKKYGVAVLDLYATSGFYPDNTTNYNAICPDGRHPNDVGHVKLANRISGFLTTV